MKRFIQEIYLIVINYLKDNLELLKSHIGFLKYFKNTSWLFFEHILRMTLGLFIGVWVARYLGPNQFGLFSYVQALVAMASIFATLGIESILVRELVKNNNRNYSLIGAAFVLRLAASILVITVLIIALKLFSNEQQTNVLVFVVASSIIFQSFGVINAYFQSIVLSKYTVYANSLSFFVSSVIKVLLIIYEAPLVAFAYVVLLDSILVAGLLLYFYINYVSLGDIKKITYENNLAIMLLKDSWPLMLTGLAIVIYMKIDKIMIKQIIGNEALGQYAAAARISELWYFIPLAITTSLFPAIINAKNINNDLYNIRICRLYSFMLWLGLVVAIITFFSADFIVDFLYGNQYYDASKVLIIHMWAGIFVAVGMASSRWMVCENLQLMACFHTAIAALLNIMLNIFLIPKFGISGAAYATVFSYAVSSYLLHAFHSTTRSNFINISKSFIPKF